MADPLQRDETAIVRSIRRVLPWLPETDGSKKRSPSAATRGAEVSVAIPFKPKEGEDDGK